MVRRVVRYSEAFKLQVVSELESGSLDGIEDARRRYGTRAKSSAGIAVTVLSPWAVLKRCKWLLRPCLMAVIRFTILTVAVSIVATNTCNGCRIAA